MSADVDCRDRMREILFLGRIHPKKGLFALLNAWKALPEGLRRDWKLRIVGWDDGGHKRDLELMLNSFALKDSVTIEGPVFGADKRKIMQSASLFVLPSYSEGLPMAVLEAWEAGLPVMKTPQCNLAIGFDRLAAIRIDPTSQSIFEGLTAFFHLSTDDRQRIGQNGRKLVCEKFTWPVVAKQLCEVYRWTAGFGDLPACVHLYA